MRVDQAVGDKGLLDVIQAQNADLSSRLDTLTACFASAGSVRTPLTAEDFADARGRLARGIETANKNVNVETTQGTKKVHISKLVINSRLVPIAIGGKLPMPHRDSADAYQRTIGYLSFRKSFNRALILGDPGGGKSTLTQLLCHGLAGQVNSESARLDHISSDSRDLKLPLRVILRSLERRQQKLPSYSIFDYLVDETKVNLDNDVDLTTIFLKQLLVLGEAVILFDGLDEILDIGERRNMTAYIEQFTNAYASCPCLVTSRIVGYGDAPLSDDFQPYILARFDKEEVRKFSVQLLRAVSNLKVAEAGKQADAFISQTETVAEDLRENPLLLGLMVYIFAIRGNVPNNRPEIYKECALLMFEKWDQRRDIIFEFPQDFDLLDLFGFLARNIFGDAATEDGVDRDWLLSKLRLFFEAWYEDRARALAAAKALLAFITGRAWVMCEVGPRVYKFTHRTFLEYFFARRLEEEAGSVVALVQTCLFEKIINSQWDVVSHLALQIATFRSGPKSQQAANCLFDLAVDVKFDPREELNFLSFIARSLEYLTLPEAKVKEFASQILARAIFLGAHYSLDAIELVHESLFANRRRGGLIAKELVAISRRSLQGASCPERDFVMYLMGTRYAGHRSARGRWNPKEGALIWETLSNLRKEMRGEQARRASKEVNEARSMLYVYQRYYLSFYKQYGLSVLFPRPSSLVPIDLFALPYLILDRAVDLLVGSRRQPAPMEIRDDDVEKLVSLMATDFIKSGPRGIILTSRGNMFMISILDDVLRNLHRLLRRSRISDTTMRRLSECLLCYICLLEIETLVSRDERVGRPLAAREIPASLRRVRELLKENASRFERQALGAEIIQWASGERTFYTFSGVDGKVPL